MNSLVVIEKPNKSVRLCLDPRELNKSILREHFPMKTMEEIKAKTKNVKVYNVLDASNDNWKHLPMQSDKRQSEIYNMQLFFCKL